MRKIIWVLILILLLGMACLPLGMVGCGGTPKTEELSQQLEKKIQTWEKRTFKRPPLFGEPMSGNAFISYQEIETSFEKPKKEIINQLHKVVNDPSKTLGAEALAYYNRNKSIVELIKKGCQVETYKPLIDIRKGFDAARITSLVNTKTIPAVVVLQFRELVKNNQHSDAIKLYCSSLRFHDDYMRNGEVITVLLAIHAAKFESDEIRRYLIEQTLSEQHLTELKTYLKILMDTEPSLQDAMETDRLLIEVELRQGAESGNISSWFRDSLPETGNKTDYTNAWEDILVFCPRIEKTYSLPYAQANVEENEIFKEEIAFLKNRISQRFLLGFIGFNSRYLSMRALRRGIYILTALKLYQHKYQIYPDKLADLSPEIILEVPLDPFTEKPFVYKLDKDGTLFLYSIGKNLTDDGGDQERDKDIVISPAEIQKKE